MLSGPLAAPRAQQSYIGLTRLSNSRVVCQRSIAWSFQNWTSWSGDFRTCVCFSLLDASIVFQCQILCGYKDWQNPLSVPVVILPWSKPNNRLLYSLLLGQHFRLGYSFCKSCIHSSLEFQRLYTWKEYCNINNHHQFFLFISPIRPYSNPLIMSPCPTVCNVFREGDIMKAKPKHFIPRPDGSVCYTKSSSIYVTHHLQHIGKRRPTPCDCPQSSGPPGICICCANVSLPPTRHPHTECFEIWPPCRSRERGESGEYRPAESHPLWESKA